MRFVYVLIEDTVHGTPDFWSPTDLAELAVQESDCVTARLHRRFLSQQLNATQCNFCRAGEVATSCDFIAILVQFVSVNVSTRLLLN